MEQINMLASNNLVVLLGILTVIILIMLEMLVSVKGKLNALQKKYDFFMQGEDMSIDSLLTNT